jgi:hypothetical protein
VDKADLRSHVQRDMREARSGQTSGSYFSDDDIDEAVNDGYMEMSDASEWFEEYLEFDLLKDRRYYDLFTLIGKFFLSIRPAFDEQVNRWLIPTPVRTLDNSDPRWERVVGRPQRFFLRGLRWLGFWPRYGSDGTTVKQYYTRLPVPLCEDSDEPQFPEAYHMGLVLYAETELYAADGETNLALEAWKQYLEYEKELVAWVNKREDRPLGRVLGSATVPR